MCMVMVRDHDHDGHEDECQPGVDCIVFVQQRSA